MVAYERFARSSRTLSVVHSTSAKSGCGLLREGPRGIPIPQTVNSNWKAIKGRAHGGRPRATTRRAKI